MKDKYVDYINQIIGFYSNQNLSLDSDSEIFREGNPEDWVLPRLERAAKDEAFDEFLHSRYAIWAASVNDLIRNAMKVIEVQDIQEAQRQLSLASNAMQAYRDIQTIFDNDFYRVSDIFRKYVLHLLNIDDQISEIIDRDGIIKRLKLYSAVSGASLPRDIDFSIKNRVLRVFINNETQNMQEDSAAFEGWIIILKSRLGEDVKYVELDFSIINETTELYGNPKVCHYNRFLYRIHNLIRLYPNWFFLHESKTKILYDFMQWLKSSACLLNHSLQERESVIETEKMERQIESWFAFEDGKKLLCKHWNIDENKLFNQLPIGVFYHMIASKNAIFTRGASAIDLWGIGNDEKTLHLIELKCGANKGIGVISEVLFYTAVIYDACIAEDNLFIFGKYGKAPDTKDMIAIKNGGKRFERLSAHILAEIYHPLFDHKVEDMICEGLSNLNIDFSIATYDYSKKALIDENNDL